MRKSGVDILVASIIAVVVAVVVGGLILLGSPTQERMRRLDSQRVADLRAVASAVDLYWTRHQTLPFSLEELSREPGGFVRLMDPDTKRPYEYRVLNGHTYELCAEFVRDWTDQHDVLYKDFWAHGAGRQCFKLEVKEIKR